MFHLTKNKLNLIFNLYLKINGFFSLFVILLIFTFLIKESYLSIHTNFFNFFFDESWFPSENQFNILPMITGSLLVTFGAIIIALPLGLFNAIFTVFYAPPVLKVFIRSFIELFTGIPSVIFGFWGLMKLVPLLNEINPPGQNLLAGILILALMIFPIICLNLTAAFEISAKKDYLVSQSLGISTSTYIWTVLIPNVKKQLVSAIFLAMGRAIGETMAVLMVCGNIVRIPTTVFDPIRTLTANIALEMSYATDIHRSALFFTGVILLVIVCLFFFISHLLQVRMKKWR